MSDIRFPDPEMLCVDEGHSASPIADLIRVAELLALLDDPAAARTATRLNRLLTGETDDVAGALDLKTAPGQWQESTRRRYATRNDMLRQAAESFGLSPAVLARRFARFASTAWPNYQTETGCPKHLCGRPDEFFFYAMQAVPRTIGEQQLRTIIGTEES